MREEATSRKVVRNTLFNYLAVFTLVLVRFASLPIIIHGLGDARYGIYATVMGVVSYVGLLDLGIGVSLTKFVAEYYATREFRRLNDMISTALLLYIGLGVLGVGILTGFSGLFVRNVFQVPEPLWAEARTVFCISAFTLFNGLTLGVFGNLLNGVQRQDIARSITIGNTVITYGGAVLLVLVGYKLVAFVLYGALVNFLSFLLQAFIAKRLLPEVRLLPRAFKNTEIKRIAHFSFAMFVNQLAARNMATLDKIVLGIFLPIANVTLYAIAVTVATFCFRIPAAAVLASLPAASELAAQNRQEDLHKLILRGMKYTGIVGLLVFPSVGILAQDIIRLWMGNGYETSAVILQILLFGYFWLVISASSQSVMVGIGRPYVNTVYAVLQILLCSVLIVVLVAFYGLIGAAVGALVAYTLGGIIYQIHSIIIFGIPFQRIFNSAIMARVFLMIVPGVVWATIHHLYPPRGLPGLLAHLSCYLLLYGLLVIRYHIDDFDMEMVGAVVPAVRRLEFLRRR